MSYRWSKGWRQWVPEPDIPLEPLGTGPLEPAPVHPQDCACGSCFFRRRVPNDELYAKRRYDRDWWQS